ncbi:hypothetical protein KC968_04850 [Candidatus Saccharibacteria bacterium]|nr:hypothetical protein [Candidatus Saccharibacteria bacterium]MCB0331363.1 hypothetical protein [Bdellovibrionales bacterium]
MQLQPQTSRALNLEIGRVTDPVVEQPIQSLDVEPGTAREDYDARAVSGRILRGSFSSAPNMELYTAAGINLGEASTGPTTDIRLTYLAGLNAGTEAETPLNGIRPDISLQDLRTVNHAQNIQSLGLDTIAEAVDAQIQSLAERLNRTETPVVGLAA